MKTQFIKKAMALFSIMSLIFIYSCEKSDDLISDDITGTYIGTLTLNQAGKSSETAKAEAVPATIVINEVGNQIQVHCLTEDFDTTVILDIYHNGDDIMVCLTGDDFENMYGHMYGQGNMMHGNMQHNSSEWMQHLNNEHQEGDEHFGSFDMQHHSFNYTFRMSNGDFHFQGIRQ